ncbi:hypothetical protein SAMN05216243_0066 [Sediminibacillus albus]|uniref:Uncharacterized protein n=1 Tax=Sediminibacillus albus TaxID=407036 RepID=A0A1G9DAS7_9BACI|nr:hypothetical protein SAMN05216243_0066 [Sediminibacillus albus]
MFNIVEITIKKQKPNQSDRDSGILHSFARDLEGKAKVS